MVDLMIEDSDDDSDNNGANDADNDATHNISSTKGLSHSLVGRAKKADKKCYTLGHISYFMSPLAILIYIYIYNDSVV